jgi:hypothetical protein
MYSVTNQPTDHMLSEKLMLTHLVTNPSFVSNRRVHYRVHISLSKKYEFRLYDTHPISLNIHFTLSSNLRLCLQMTRLKINNQ